MKSIVSFKKEKKVSKKLIAILITIVVLLIAVVGFLYYSKLSTYTFQEPAVYYVNGIAFYLDSGTKAILQSENYVTLESPNQQTIEARDLAVYYSGKSSILTVCPMAYYVSNQQGKVYATQIHPLSTIDAEFEYVTISKGAKQLTEQGNFLFDGIDGYIVLRSCELLIGEEHISLSPLSYVMCSYGGYVMYWDHDTDNFEFRIFEDDKRENVNIYFAEDDILVQCDLDRLKRGDSESFMLSSAITMLSETLK